MSESEKSKLKLVKGGVKSFEDYKRMMNGLSQAMFGRPTSMSDEQLKKRYEAVMKKLAEDRNDK
jgi:hypothetical protein